MLFDPLKAVKYLVPAAKRRSTQDRLANATLIALAALAAHL
jgi:hypothetical protein